MDTLNTIEFGNIRIVHKGDIDKTFDTLIGQDLIGEWLFFELHDIDLDKDYEIVAVSSDEY